MKAERARATYNRIGRFQDAQAFYERRPVADLVAHLQLGTAGHVVEIGCGTAKLATRLLQSDLPADATYQGFDVSDTMVRLATKNLRRFQDRASVDRVDIISVDPPTIGPADRVISAYVLDLLDTEQTRAFFAAIETILEPDGLLGVVSLSHGSTGPSALVAKVWSAVARRRPGLVGGCRPIDVRASVEAHGFNVIHHAAIASFGVPSEIVIARPGGPSLGL